MDKRICVYEAGETDFSTNGLGMIAPTKCAVHWTENGEYSAEIVHPIDEYGKYLRLNAYERTVVIPVPEAPSMRLRSMAKTEFVDVYAVSGGKVNLRAGPSTGYRSLKVYRRGNAMAIIAKTNSSWYEVTAYDGLHGWMSTKYLRYSHSVPVATAAAEIMRDMPMRPQPFDIYAVIPGVDQITARLRHVFYRLAETVVCSLEIKNKTAQQALDAAFAAAEDQDLVGGFQWYCEDTEALSLEDSIDGKSLTDVILGDGGICQTYGLKLLVDWFDIFLVKDIGQNRGVQVRYGKNLEKMNGNGFDISNVTTRVIPVGQTKDGKPLYLGTGSAKYLQSEHEDMYARPRYGCLRVNEAKVGSEVNGKKLTTTTARELMRKTAQEQLDAGCDLPDCSLSVKMLLLRRSPEYAQYAPLEAVCPGDTLGLFVPNFGIALNVRVSEYSFDAISQYYDELTIGTPCVNLSNSGVSSRQLGKASVSASKLAYGAVGSSALAQDVVSARHVQAESINTQALQAEAVTAEKIAAGSVTAEKMEANLIETTALDAFTAKIQKLTASDIETDTLAAALAAFTVLTAGTASFDRATVQHLVAQAMNLEFGVAGQVFVKNLAVEYAQMVGAAIGELCIKASDGNYYLMDVSPDGTVTATLATVSDDEITAGETAGGKVILETNITAANLNTGNLLATYALINRIDAARIDVDEFFAREAVIGLLRTTKIVGEKSITMIAGEAEEAKEAVDNLDRLTDIEVIEGTFVQAERREGEGIHIFSEFGPKQDETWGDPYPGGAGKNLCSVERMEDVAWAYDNSGVLQVLNSLPAGTYTFSAKWKVTGTSTSNGSMTSTDLYGIGFYGTDNVAWFRSQRVWNMVSIGSIVESSWAFTIKDEHAGNFTHAYLYGVGNNTVGATGYATIYEIQIEAGDTFTGFAPYANTPAIEGWTELNAGAFGANALEYDKWKTAATVRGTAVWENNGVTLTATENDAFTWYNVGLFPVHIPVVSGQTITISWTHSGGYGLVYVFGNGGVANMRNAASTSGILTWTVPDGITFITFRFGVSTAGETASYENIMINYGPEALPYEPYQGTTSSIDFGETVYGGAVDWNKGELTVGWTIVDLSTLGWMYSNNYWIATFLTEAAQVESNATPPAWVSDRYKVVPRDDLSDYTITLNILGNVMCMNGSTTEKPSGMLAYKLAEPYTIQLTPVQLTTLKGLNTVYTDADGGRVEFGHDPLANTVDALEGTLKDVQATANDALPRVDFQRVVRIDDEGLHVGDNQSGGEVLIDSASMNVVLNGAKYSSFTSNFVQFGNYQLRKTADGGLAFKLR